MPTHSAPPAGEVNEYEEDPDLRRELKKARITPDDALWLQSLQEETIDLHTALMDTEQVMVMEFNLEFTSNREKKNFIRDPHLFLVKQMRSSEVNLKKLTPQLRELFHRAKAKEVRSFLKNEAVRKCLDNKEIQEAYNSGRIMRARWVLTWKLVPDEEHPEALRDAMSNAQTMVTPDGRKKAKARIVVLGFEHPDLLDPSFRTSSPVQTNLGRNLLYLMTCQHGWELEGLDLATAFLQTQKTEEESKLWTYGTEELREALGVGSRTCTAPPRHPVDFGRTSMQPSNVLVASP